MQTRRAVLTKRDQADFHCEVGCPGERSTVPFQYVIWGAELYVRVESMDQHDDDKRNGGRICAFRFVEHYEI